MMSDAVGLGRTPPSRFSAIAALTTCGGTPRPARDPRFRCSGGPWSPTRRSPVWSRGLVRIDARGREVEVTDALEVVGTDVAPAAGVWHSAPSLWECTGRHPCPRDDTRPVGIGSLHRRLRRHRHNRRSRRITDDRTREVQTASRMRMAPAQMAASAALAGADADDLLERAHEDLAVADPAGAGRLHDRLDRRSPRSSSQTTTSIFTLGRKSTTYSAPR